MSHFIHRVDDKRFVNHRTERTPSEGEVEVEALRSPLEGTPSGLSATSPKSDNLTVEFAYQIFIVVFGGGRRGRGKISEFCF